MPWLYKKNDSEDYDTLSFHRVDSYLGYRRKVRLFKNGEGDFWREEFYDAKNDNLEFILENEFEYYNSKLEIIAQEILKNGWDTNYIDSLFDVASSLGCKQSQIAMP